MAARLTFVGRRPDGDQAALVQRIEDERDGNIRPIRLPWWQLNRGMNFGLLPGNLTILAGMAGVAKSLLSLNIMLAAHRQEFTWRLLPLEDDGMTWILKLLAVHLNDWRLLAQPENDTDEDRRRVAEYKLMAVERNRALIDELHDRHVAESPRMPFTAFDATTVIDVDYKMVLDFVEEESFRSQLICIDPISQITFDPNGKDWLGQSDFLRKLAAIAAQWKSHVILVAHTTKQAARNGVGDTLDGLQGSAMIGRLAHNVITVARHDPMESEVFSSTFPTAMHKMTLTLAKCRNGFSGSRYAFDLSDSGPTFIERGLIRPKAARQRGNQ